jgi:YfiH family protein
LPADNDPKGDLELILAAEDGLSCYQFENLAACQGIKHRIFTRVGGASQPPFSSLNVTFGIGDEEDHVIRNREIIARSMQAKELVCSRQVHGTNVAVFTREMRRQSHQSDVGLSPADALVTDQSQKYLMIQVADCQAVLMHDPARQVVANVHCGWRGSIQNIIGRTIETMRQRFDCHPAHIQAGIGPSLGPCCAEFVNYPTEIPEVFWRYKNATHYFDFWAISRDQLLRAGVLAENIESSGICTRCRTDEFYSYRAAKTTGRFAAVIGLQ